MANNPSAAKRARQSLRRRTRNRSTRSVARTATRRVREAAAAGDVAAFESALSVAYSRLDRAAKTGSIHTGKADRAKRRLAALRPEAPV